MKNYGHLFLLSLLILFAGILSAQQRGFQQINLTVDGQTTPLYSGSHALVIGVSDYTDGWSDLYGVKSDVNRVKAALEKQDFNVVLIEDPTNSELKAAFDSFISKYGRSLNNRLLVYFSGHGYTMKKGWGGDMGYIVPSDAPDPNKNADGFKDKALDMELMEVYAKRIDSKHALFMFDCCFSGSVFSMSKAAPAIINYKTKEPVRQFITAGTADEEVPDKSIFCNEFIEALNGNGDRDGDGYLTGSELGEYLQTQVVNYSNETQHPQYGKIRNPNLDKGDFVFVLNSQTMETLQLKEVVISEPERIIRYGSIELTTEISGSLYLDGTYLSQVTKDTRMTLNSVTTGTHTLKITGDEAWQETVNVTENITSQTTAKITRLEVKNFDWETEMIFVKGGSFTMGCTPEQGSNCFSDEKPSHQVILNDYYIGKYEVTRNQWSEVMGSIPIRFFGCIDCPINGADWSEIQEFIKRLNQKTGKNYRLPTEAEWEYAARGGNRSSGFIYSGSNVIDEVAWYGGNSEKKTHPVGQKKPNNLGLYDMSGNVNELCVDWYVEYDDISQFNPRGPEKGDHHVHRGGAWDEGMWYRSSSGYCRVSNRETSLSDRGEGYCHIGFRLCRSAE